MSSFQDDHIRYAQLSVRRKNIHHIDLLLSDRFIFQANIHVHRIFKLEPVGLEQSVVAIFPLEEIILRSKSQLTRRPLLTLNKSCYISPQSPGVQPIRRYC